jgi:hypothetical protein
MLSFTEMRVCKLRRFVAEKSCKVIKKVDGKDKVYWWMLVIEEKQDNEENHVFKHPWPLILPDGYVRFENGFCVVVSAKCWAMRIDLEKIVITFAENSPPSIPEYDYMTFKSIFQLID